MLWPGVLVVLPGWLVVGSEDAVVDERPVAAVADGRGAVGSDEHAANSTMAKPNARTAHPCRRVRPAGSRNNAIMRAGPW